MKSSFFSGKSKSFELLKCTSFYSLVYVRDNIAERSYYSKILIRHESLLKI